MAITRLLPPKLVAIADAIRNKTGETELMTIDEMPDNIENVKGDDYFLQYLNDELIEYETDVDIDWGYRGTLNTANISPFQFLQNLKYISMPNVTKTITGNYMFANMPGLEEIYAPKMDVYDASNNQGYNQLFYNDRNLKKVVIHGVSLGSSATYSQTFYNCSSLEYLEFTAATLVKINTTSLLTGCLNIKALVFSNITNVPSGSSSVLGSNNGFTAGTAYMYVPDNKVNSFKSSSPWSTYATQIKPISELPDEYK